MALPKPMWMKKAKHRRTYNAFSAQPKTWSALLGLDKEWAYRALKATGNYGEIFERNVGKAPR